ncbi:ABC transporter permease [uncultured Paraglaciecola sp.]|uniref:ABC transporter permease n=1 Tax=uncultured Paraglaciecola sp. TaxID=1765024 RepID=UPI00262A7DD5|nr:ABC transporter permease [uncultured Paraglaciecola sp.]
MIIQSIKKEFILVFSDLHSVAVLLFMPVIFMLIMTFAMSERQDQVIQNLDVELRTNNEFAQRLLGRYLSQFGYQLSADKPNASAKLTLSPDLNQGLFSGQNNTLVQITFAPSTSPAIQALLNQHLQMAFARVKLHLYMLDTGELQQDLPLDAQMLQINQQTDTAGYIKIAAENQELPVVSYSVPSWLVFGVYFIVLPISLTLINEVQSGTLIRLKTFPVNLQHYFLVKLLAFYLFSLGQFLVLSLIGWRLIPLLIDLPVIPYNQVAELLCTALVVSLAAVSFASIIAAVVQSFEQAIVLGGGVNIIMAALSGFMVPLDVMPKVLQQIAQFSPMYWSAQLVKGTMYGQFSHEHWKSVIFLCIFATISLLISALLFRRKTRKLSWN